MATIIGNENDVIRWEKDSCHKYCITNKTDFPVDVVVEDTTPQESTNPRKWIFTLQAESSYGIDLEVDGVYKICAYHTEGTFLSSSSTTIAGVTTVFQDYLLNPKPLHELLTFSLDGVVVYDGSIHGTSNFVVPGLSGSLSNFIARMVSLGYTVSVFEPAQDPSGTYPWLTTSAVYRIVLSKDGHIGVGVITTTGAPVATWSVDTNYCEWKMGAGSGAAGEDWLSSLIVDGVNILGTGGMPFYYDTTDPGYPANLYADIENYLSLSCDTIVVPASGLSLGVHSANDVCRFFESHTFAALTFPSYTGTSCDYIYELCNLYECVNTLMRNWLCCYDPCKDPCLQEADPQAEAKRKLDYLSKLFFFGILPLVTEDRLWSLGDLLPTPGRIERVGRIESLYSKIRSFLHSCGFSCDPVPCDPCKQIGVSGYVVNTAFSKANCGCGTTPCGCGC